MNALSERLAFESARLRLVKTMRCPRFAGDSVRLRGWSPNGNLEQPVSTSVPA
jgi:hypothetical protein